MESNNRNRKFQSNKSKSFRPSPQRKGKYGGKRSKDEPESDLIRLNKYISNAGICSRREADKLITSGVITVNGKVVTDLGVKVSPGDKIKYDGVALKPEKKYYLLLNKPKGYLTTTDDPYERKTVMQLIKNACRERIYPVGRLDRDTTGLLLFTNDGEMAKKLTHPRHKVNKIYAVVLDKVLKMADMEKLQAGIKLEDGFIKPDDVAYITDASSKREVGIALHSGKNRIVRRIFESMDYKVVKLDRVSFAGLTKKDVPRGKWRFLTQKEISFLKML